MGNTCVLGRNDGPVSKLDRHRDRERYHFLKAKEKGENGGTCGNSEFDEEDADGRCVIPSPFADAAKINRERRRQQAAKRYALYEGPSHVVSMHLHKSAHVLFVTFVQDDSPTEIGPAHEGAFGVSVCEVTRDDPLNESPEGELCSQRSSESVSAFLMPPVFMGDDSYDCDTPLPHSVLEGRASTSVSGSPSPGTRDIERLTLYMPLGAADDRLSNLRAHRRLVD